MIQVYQLRVVSHAKKLLSDFITKYLSLLISLFLLCLTSFESILQYIFNSFLSNTYNIICCNEDNHCLKMDAFQVSSILIITIIIYQSEIKLSYIVIHMLDIYNIPILTTDHNIKMLYPTSTSQNVLHRLCKHRYMDRWYSSNFNRCYK